LNVTLLALAGQTHGSVSVGAEGAGRTANGTRYKHNQHINAFGLGATVNNEYRRTQICY